jgi:hypothetical protein
VFVGILIIILFVRVHGVKLCADTWGILCMCSCEHVCTCTFVYTHISQLLAQEYEILRLGLIIIILIFGQPVLSFSEVLLGLS